MNYATKGLLQAVKETVLKGIANELCEAYSNLTATQVRCTELLEEARSLRRQHAGLLEEVQVLRLAVRLLEFLSVPLYFDREMFDGRFRIASRGRMVAIEAKSRGVRR